MNLIHFINATRTLVHVFIKLVLTKTPQLKLMLKL